MNDADDVNWRRWLGHLAGKPDVRGCEIGVFAGESAVWMCKNIFYGPGAEYAGIDTFEGNPEHVSGGENMTLHEAAARKVMEPFKQFTMLKTTSALALRVPTFYQALDFVYVDGAHDAKSVLRDAVMGWECLKVGGIMILDDYLWEVLPNAMDRPRMAIDAFWACYQREAVMLSACNEWQVCLKKTA